MPVPIQKSFDDLLAEKSIPVKYRPYYHKWLRYYLDFCWKYNLSDKSRSSMAPFLDKLRERNQLNYLIEHAAHAVSLYYRLISSEAERTDDNQKRSGSSQAVKASVPKGSAPPDHPVGKPNTYVPRHPNRDDSRKPRKPFTVMDHPNGPRHDPGWPKLFRSGTIPPKH